MTTQANTGLLFYIKPKDPKNPPKRAKNKIAKPRGKEENRRYKLHQRIKSKCRYIASQKKVYVPHDYDINDKDFNELKNKFNYNIQLEIL